MVGIYMIPITWLKPNKPLNNNPISIIKKYD